MLHTGVAQASELGSCQSYLSLSWGFEQLQKSKDPLRAKYIGVCDLIRSNTVKHFLMDFNIFNNL